MKRILLLAPLLLAACQSLPHRTEDASSSATPASIEGQYDNHEQIWAEREGGANPSAHVVVAIEPTRRPEWTIWHVRLDVAPPLSAAWAMRRVDATTWLPYRALVAAPAGGDAFDAAQWTPLEACALRGEAFGGGGVRARADVAACSAIAPGIGAQAALLPIGLEVEDEWLRLRLYADQARGPQARAEARRVVYFGGWAAINGGGPGAAADSSDWHMDRNVRLSSEGGRAPLLWRDGKRSGYSLALERLTYRDGNVPVLKLSVVDDADGRTLAYAWTNPQATRIGINLGWVQVGLDRARASP
jgi:hypothetical protein